MEWLDKGTEPPEVEGCFRAGEITAELIESRFESGSELEKVIEQEWKARLAGAADRGAELFDGPLARLVSWEVLGNVLQMSLQRTSYRYFVGTNLRDPDLPDAQRADPLGNSAVILSADGRVILGRRSSKVHGHPGWVHCVGGHVNPERRVSKGVLDTFESIIDEVVEELNVERDDIEDIVCHGIVRDAASRQPEQLFTVQVKLRSDQLRPTGSEHAALVAFPDSRKEIDKFFDECGEFTVPVARAALRAHAGI